MGITTFTAFFTLLFFNRISITEQFLIGRIISDNNIPDIPRLIKIVFITTIVIELIGALFLFLSWYSSFPSFQKALFSSIFHSVSAFCNAGFSTFSNNLINYTGNIAVNIIICILIILGGIGFIVIFNIYQHFFSPQKKIINIHTKIVLLITGFLLISGALLFFLCEYNRSMKELPLTIKILTSFFYSISTRTAGFNTIPVASFSQPLLFVLMFLMFIGASPNSTGGGIKTSTFGVLIGTVIAVFKGKAHVELFRRRIPPEIVYRTLALTVISSIYIFIIFILLLCLESFSSTSILFETISAFGTVGLSTGITSALKDVSKILLIMTMFIGRIGPITLTLSLISFKKVSGIINPQENNILVG